MNITDVRVRKTFGEGKLKAVVSITLDNAFVIHDIKILEREDKTRFVAMPSKKNAEGKFKDIVHPIDNDNRKLMESIVLSAYDQIDKEDK